MSHLSAERLASLADAGPMTGEEAAHLAACATCAAERAAHRRLLAMALDERTRLAPPLTDWTALRAALHDEGMLAGAGASLSALGARLSGGTAAERTRPPAAGTRPRAESVRPLFSRRAGLRVAAGLLIAAGGAAIGRLSAGVPPLPVLTVASAVSPSPERGLDSMRGAGVSGTALVADSTATFGSTTEALVALARAEEQYQLAAAFLLQHDSASGMSGERTRSTDDSSNVYKMRLAALDNVMAASREALYEAPHDPVINRYYLATLGAREATLRQLNTSLPAGARLTRF